MIRRRALATSALVALSLAACENDDNHTTGPKGQSSFERYVALGTSVSQGTQSDGVVYFTQEFSFPAQLAHAALAQFTQPLVSTSTTGTTGGYGCNAPLVAPLQLGVRYNGRATADTSCSPLVLGITLPTNNVAIDGARAYSALYTTIDSALAQGAGRVGGKLYSRVLLPRQTQVTAMRAQNPTLVSVEFGANELLGAASGILIPSTNGRDGTYVPLAVFQPIYDKIIDSVKATGAKGLLVAPGITDVSSFPLFRTGAEINSQAAVLRAGFNVAVAPDCGTTSAANIVAMTVVLNTVGAAARSATPLPLSCADRPGTADGILTPADLTVINGVQLALTNYIKGKATENGYAYMQLGDLYNGVKGTTPFSVAALLGSTTPYGPNISLDGVHPSNSGSTILARSAATALNAQYGFQITVP